ncbi:MAG: Rid family hydrolase [Bryobacteraceae bacterium]
MSRFRQLALVASLAVWSVGPLWTYQKKKDKEITQVLDLPKDPPMAVVADADKLVFHVSTLSTKGLLSQQTRDALKTINRLNKGANLIKLRAFVAGTGDMRRVQASVSETFERRRKPIPALSVIQVGALPLEGAQVVLEATSAHRKVQNENGLAFISGQASVTKDPLGPLEAAVNSAGLDGESVLRVTCLLSSLETNDTLRAQAAKAFPQAAINVVQLQRAPIEDFAECEAVAALKTKPERPLTFLESKTGSYSQIALVGPGKLAITGTQLAFRQQDDDVRLAFERIGSALESAGTDFKNVAMTRIYPLTGRTADQVRKIRFEFLDKERPPASTLVLFQGLPSLDASFAIDAVAVVP